MDASVKKFLITVLAAGFFLRLGYGIARPPAVPNADFYVDLAASFARTGSLLDDAGRPSAWREPGYPVLLGILFKAFGPGYPTVLAANCVLGVWMLWLLFLLGRALYGERVGLGAAAVGAFYPPFIYYAAQPLRESALAFWTVLSLWLLDKARRDWSPRAGLAAGASVAAAVLTKSTLLPFGLILAPLGMLVCARRESAPAKRAAGAAACYLAAFIGLYGLWPLRNWLALGSPILGNVEGGGSNFYQYLIVPQEEGGTPRQAEILGKDPVFAASGRLGPVERDRFLWKAGLNIVRRSPRAYARLVAWRFFWDQWRLFPRPRAYGHSYGAIRWISLLTDGWIIPLGFLGIALAGLEAPAGLWLCLYLFSETFVYALIFSTIRYRFSRMPILILYACVALERLWRRSRPARAHLD